MKESKRVLVVPEVATQHIKTIVGDILKGNLRDDEKALIQEKRTYYSSVEGDMGVFDAIAALREDVEPIEKWKETSAKAEEEVKDLPPDILEQLLERFTPYIKSMPAGHSRGHYLRDTVNLTALLNDPAMKQYKKAEVMAGLFAGVGHDIGTSVVSRYDDGIRFSGHAEVGAHLFGEVAKDILPPNILKMAQLGIAAHTHYTKDLAITRDGQERVRKQYDDEVVDGHKISVWMARWADRLDTRGPFHAVRHILTKAMPTADYTGKEFEAIGNDEFVDFKTHFAPQREKPNVLWHLMLFADSDFKDPPVYNLHDTPYMTNQLFGPEDKRHMDFVDAVEDHYNQIDSMSDAQKQQLRERGFENFYNLCRLLEPAADTEKQIDLLKRKFGMLGENPETQRSLDHWALGFDVLTQKLYPASYAEKQKKIASTYDVITARTNGEDSLGQHHHTLANEVWSRFSPERSS